MVLKENLEVLAVHNTGSWLQIMMIVFGIIFGITCLICLIVVLVDSWCIFAKLMLCALTVLFIGCAVVGGVSMTKHPYYLYDVVIPDGYPIEDLINDYRIVSHDGNLYTIIDKNQPII